MIIEIKDDLSGQERTDLLKLLPLKYALKLFDGNKTVAAMWLGKSKRWVLDTCAANAELKELYGLPNNSRRLETKIRELRRTGIDVYNSFFYRYLSDEDKQSVDNLLKNITRERKLYHWEDTVKIIGPNDKMRGNCNGITGDCTGIYGCCTGIVCDLDDYNLKKIDRVKGIFIKDLVRV